MPPCRRQLDGDPAKDGPTGTDETAGQLSVALRSPAHVAGTLLALRLQDGPANASQRGSRTGEGRRLNSVAGGAIWMVAFRFADRFAGMASTLVLARLLLPSDFGLVAMAMSVVALIELIRAFGFDSALIQRQEVSRKHFDSAFSLNLLLGLLCGAMLAALAIPAASFYKEPRLVAVILCLAAASVIQAAENPGTAEFRRHLDFRTEFVFLLAKRVLSLVAVITSAVLLRTYWALVIGIVVGRLAAVTLSYVFHPFRPRLDFAASRDLLSFSGWLLATNILLFANGRASHFVIGRLLGPGSLGTFALGSEIASLPSTELLAPANRALLPAYARASHDREFLRKGFLRVLGITTLVAVPASLGLAGIAEPLVLLLLSDKWRDAITVIQVMSVAGALGVLTACVYPIYLAIGRPRIATTLTAIRVPVAIPLMAYGAHRLGLPGVALAELLTTLLFVPISLIIVVQVLQLRAMDIVSRVWRPFGAAAVMVTVVYAVLHVAGADDGFRREWWLLAGAVVAGVLTYILVIGVLWALRRPEESAESEMVKMLASFWTAYRLSRTESTSIAPEARARSGQP